ncbi:protein FAR1-RELATED SEQUENCE 9-like [Arachis hypogaea]|nr:protein FAR1-RELATED SEQUENCE 9-like [Arachis hypogaea]
MCSPRFTSKFKDCMLGDYEIPVFCNKWQTLVEEFGVEEKEWLNEIYEKRRSWATCYIRGKFFAGFRTISRCEGLHSLIKKYTKPHYELSEFIENFQRMLGHMRFREFYAEYESARGVPVMQTCIEPLEMCAADTYTREVFFLFRPILVRLDAMKVLDYQTRDNSVIYYVCRYAKPTNVWVVESVDNGNVITCSCMRMESFGIPCEHIISVLVRRDVREIPKCLVLHRWTKKAKESMSEPSSFTSELQASSRLCILNEYARMMSEVACATTERFHETRDLMLDLYSSYKALDEGNTPSKPGLGGGTNPKGLVVRKSPNVAAIARNLVIIKLLV